MFFHNNQDIACIQAPLNYYNYRHNHLTKCFALEYVNSFDFMLLGINRLNLPVLLGGSSNHFRIDILCKLKGWDPYNVTEDADLRIKLYRNKYKTYVLQGYITLEKSPIKISSWTKQRARRIKGYVITYIVHMNNAKKLISDIGIKAFLMLQAFMIIPIIGYFFINILVCNNPLENKLFDYI
ncbi:MAG: glycosyltransferase [Rickettsiaceae bacterium H1]|nr:glycosyltransferase [Rickettsiaceae bacterium H1]